MSTVAESDLELIAETARQVAREHIAPLVPEIEETHRFSPELVRILAEAGFLGVIVPPELGGVEADLRTETVIMEEISKVYPSASTILTAHWFSSKLIVRHGEGEWFDEIVGRIANGEALGAIAATEPEVGSDLASLRTRARRDGDEWVIDGSKRFITNGGYCDFYVVMARTGEEGSRGISLFFVEADRPGVKVVRHERKMGLNGSATAELAFDGVRVPADHLIGAENEGFRYAMEGFDEGRLVLCALSVGIAQSALDQAVEYAKERRQFGKPIGAFQGVQFMLADMAIKTQAARSVAAEALEAHLAGRPDARRLIAIAKTFTSDACMAVTADAVQVFGGYGYVTDFPVEMLMRDAKINQIYEGTNQIQRQIIARTYLGSVARES